MENLEIGFICKNNSKLPLEGKLKLPIPFVVEYGSSLPAKVTIELPTGELWFGNYVKNSEYIEGLEKMLLFYGVRPYYLVVFEYCGGPFFKLKIFNECGVEIFYPFSCPSSGKLRPRRNDSFVVLRSSLTEIEIDKLAATRTFNALHNFLGLHDIIIEKSHLMKKSQYEVMSCRDFEKLFVDEALNTLEFRFKHFYWTIKFKRRNGILYFNHGWYDFVKAANLSEGDICVIERTADPVIFEIGVLSNTLLTQWSITAGTLFVDERVGHQCFSWYKILKGSCLESGKVEMPRLFAMRLGVELGREIKFIASDGRIFTGKYRISRNQISGLREMISAYEIYDNCVIVFYYVGNATFKVSIFDSLAVDHLKEITGEFIADIIKEIQMEESQNVHEHGAQTEVVEGDVPMAEEDDVHEVVSIQGTSDEFELEGNESDAEEPFQLNHQMHIAVEAINVFLVELKKSHFQGKGRGAYCPTRCYELYKNWTSQTIVTLYFEDHSFQLGLQRNNRSCRFGKGWDDFVRKAKVRRGEVLEFRFRHPNSMDVSKII